MTFKWTYLLVAVVVLAAVTAPALTGGGWGVLSYAWGIAAIALSGIVVLLARQSRAKPEQRPVRGGSADGNATAAPFVGYPMDRMLAIFEGSGDAGAATRDLAASGFADVNRYAGTSGALTIDSQGSEHGVASSVERTIDHLASDVSDLGQYDAAVREGHVVLGVLVEDDERRQDVADILHRHRARDVRHFGSLAAESMPVDRERTRAD